MFRFSQYHILLLQCFSIIRGDILDFQLRAAEVGCVSDDGRLIPVGDKEYISPTNVCDLCQCESDQSFVCDSRCDVINQSSDCPESERIENNDPLCPCLICPDQIVLIISLPKSQPHLLLQQQQPLQLSQLKQLRPQLLQQLLLQPPPPQLLQRLLRQPPPQLLQQLPQQPPPQLLQQPRQLLQRLLRQPPPPPQQQLPLQQQPQRLQQQRQPHLLLHQLRQPPPPPPQQQQEKKQLLVLLQER
ncbi:unnamed protein product [Rotaria socialis]|uniref:Uncharacterized protein n=1 Tax=Rotaria socialis TaxID=392032 RepID=A0A820IYY8_9BILA|nr:unnamed protein product [Rotaria socialis]CAF4314089.1 unnamed protein product [Rotaria socialis]